MTVRLGAGLVDAMIDYLGANIQGALEVEEAAWTSPRITLPPPTAFLRRDPLAPKREASRPFLHVVVARDVVYDWSSTYALTRHQLLLWLVTEHSDAETLRLMVYRYGNALFRLLRGAATSGIGYEMAGIDGAEDPEIDYGYTLTSGNLMMGDVKLITWWAGRENG